MFLINLCWDQTKVCVEYGFTCLGPDQCLCRIWFQMPGTRLRLCRVLFHMAGTRLRLCRVWFHMAGTRLRFMWVWFHMPGTRPSVCRIWFKMPWIKSTFASLSFIVNFNTKPKCFFLQIYCMSKKSWPTLYNKLLYKFGQDFLDRQYERIHPRIYFGVKL